MSEDHDQPAQVDAATAAELDLLVEQWGLEVECNGRHRVTSRQCPELVEHQAEIMVRLLRAGVWFQFYCPRRRLLVLDLRALECRRTWRAGSPRRQARQQAEPKPDPGRAWLQARPSQASRGRSEPGRRSRRRRIRRKGAF